jgi:coenzyme F420 hydrogenase subunit beta
MDDTIIKVLRNELCTGCGTCVSTCPTNAIGFHKDSNGLYVPEVNGSLCNKCGLCVKVCPGYSINFDELNNLVFSKTPDNVFLGNFINCYISYSTDNRIRWGASSGGVLSALLIFALEKKIIDAALVTKMNKENPLEPEVIVARCREDIVSASKSKYCPVPVNTAIKKLLERDEKVAVVGLPCHIAGIRKAEMVTEKLRKNVILRFGLFCSHAVNFLGTELLLEKLGIRKEDVVRLSYRGNGWPGKMTIELKGGEKKIISSSKYWGALFGSFFFTPTRCTLCCDFSNELSDISFGDAWLPELTDDKAGTSMLISRTETGESLIQKVALEEKIKVSKILPEKVIQSQLRNFYFKKKNLKARFRVVKMFGGEIPNYINCNLSSLRPSLLANFTAILPYINIHALSSQHSRSLFRYIPFPLLRVYNSIVNTLSSI